MIEIIIFLNPKTDFSIDVSELLPSSRLYICMLKVLLKMHSPEEGSDAETLDRKVRSSVKKIIIISNMY